MSTLTRLTAAPEQMAVCRTHYERYIPMQTACEFHAEHADEKCEMPYCGLRATHVAWFAQMPDGGYQLRRKFGSKEVPHGS